MSPSTNKALCVSIHDVAPATWPDCLRLLEAIRAIGKVPLTLLVVPQYHDRQECPRQYERMLDVLLAHGHELALHGYNHLDTGPVRGGFGDRFMRTVYTQMEGEFAAITAGEARRRLELGLAWFQQRNWPVTGFVAPAWLLGEGAWSALQEFPFDYTTTWGRFFLLPDRQSVFAPSMTYTTRNAPGRLLSPHWTDALEVCSRMSPLARLSLHPGDARFPHLVSHIQRLLEKLLASRVPVTKAAFAHSLRRQIIGVEHAAKTPTESQY